MMDWVFGLVAGLGIGGMVGILVERRSQVALLPKVLEAVQLVVASVAESVRFPGARGDVVPLEPGFTEKLFADLENDVSAAPSWMMDDDG